MAWLPDGEKSLKVFFIRFDRIHERDRQTDGHRVTAYTALTHTHHHHHHVACPKVDVAVPTSLLHACREDMLIEIT